MRRGSRAVVRRPVMVESLTTSNAGHPPDSDLAASLLFINLTVSILVSALLVVGSARHFHIGLFTFLVGLDAVLGQGASLLLVAEPDFRPASCRIVALFAILFTSLILSSLVSLAAYPSTYVPFYLHLAIPPFIALSISLPFAFPEVATARYFPDRYTCGFINLDKAFSVVILLLGFVVPILILLYLTYKTSLTFQWTQCSGSVTRTGNSVVFFVSLCSILLIPHIIQVNITHFSTTVLKSKSDNEIVYTSVYDTLSICLRYEYNVVTPLVILFTLEGVREEYVHILVHFRSKTRVVKYLKSSSPKSGGHSKGTTPVLYVTTDGLMLAVQNCSREADVQRPSSGRTASKGESSTSTTATDSYKTSKEKRNAGNKKIVRFAHSVKEISWKDGDRWENTSGSSRDRI